MSKVDEALQAYAELVLIRRRHRNTHLALDSVPEARKKLKGYHFPLLSIDLKFANAREKAQKLLRNLSEDEQREFYVRATFKRPGTFHA